VDPDNGGTAPGIPAIEATTRNSGWIRTGRDADEVHDQADALAHVVSDRLIDRIDALLGSRERHPTSMRFPAGRENAVAPIEGSPISH
jgi:hypothetical protein